MRKLVLLFALAASPATAAPVAVTVALSAVTLGEDCGVGKAAPKREAAKADASMVKGKMARRACEQTSMQLSVKAADSGAPTSIQVKKAELFDDKGASLGVLTARSPTIWTEAGAYQPWDERVSPKQTANVSYPMTAPDWSAVKNRYNQGYVLKVIVSVGGEDKAVEKEVRVQAPAIMPPNVKT